MHMQRAAASLAALASVFTLGTAPPAPAIADSVPSVQPPTNQTPVAPPAGQYAPAPAGAEVSGSRYDLKSQQVDRDYADQYARWAARNCIDQRTNTAAGAAIGGILGAVAGSGLAGPGGHLGGALLGGAVGATAGAAIGANTAPTTCPPGYVVTAGAPPFYYAGPPYDPGAIYGPGWYQPWVWVDGQWVYRPYRYWYWDPGAYWRAGWVAGPWRYRYHRW